MDADYLGRNLKAAGADYLGRAVAGGKDWLGRAIQDRTP